MSHYDKQREEFNDIGVQNAKAIRSDGGSSSYYSVRVDKPHSDASPYTAECIDIIIALKMDFPTGNLLKAVWRFAAHMNGVGKDGTSLEYDLNKIIFFAEVLKKQL